MTSLQLALLAYFPRADWEHPLTFLATLPVKARHQIIERAHEQEAPSG